ncbi:MAG: hypothetical protein WCI67_22415 [Chloroflexales bacterium]
MPPAFFFAPGGRPQALDIEVALAVGQHYFLVPGCSAAAELLANHPDRRIGVALDSHVFDPDRPCLDAYAEAVAGWHRRIDRFVFAISYDHLHDPDRSLVDHDRLCRRLERLGVVSDDDPVVPVAHRGSAIGDLLGPDSLEWDDIPLDVLRLPRDQTPVIALGGLAFSQYGPAGMSWMAAQLIALGLRPSGGAHLLGLARPDVLKRTTVVSFDSSRPVKQAAFGWQAIAPNFQARYGFSPDELRASRAARLAYWIIDTRDRVGLPWSPVRASDLPPARAPLCAERRFTAL